jgi:hypothetical protein
LYLSGIIVFSVCADFDLAAWNQIFFLWQTISDGSLIAWVAIYSIGTLKIKKLVKWVILYSFLRVLWEVICIVFGLNINNHWAVSATFCISAGLAFYLTLWKENRINKYLDSKLW